MFISVIRTVILYVFIIVMLRLMGKRQIGDMQPSELVVTLVVANLASIPMQNTSQPLLSGIAPVLALVSLELGVSVLMMKSRSLRRLVCGSPVVVIEDGRLLQKQMKRLRLTTDDLCAQLRQQNIFSLEDVQYCIMETNGILSVLEKPHKRKPCADDLDILIPDKKIEAVAVSDGEILKTSLDLCGHSEDDVEDEFDHFGYDPRRFFVELRLTESLYGDLVKQFDDQKSDDDYGEGKQYPAARRGAEVDQFVHEFFHFPYFPLSSFRIPPAPGGRPSQQIKLYQKIK